jgi:hypothetical protein
MALRFKTTTNLAVAGSSIAHGLGATPDEVFVLPTIAAGAGQTYRFSASDATYVYLAQGTTASSADVVAAVNHSIIK